MGNIPGTPNYVCSTNLYYHSGILRTTQLLLRLHRVLESSEYALIKIKLHSIRLVDCFLRTIIYDRRS